MIHTIHVFHSFTTWLAWATVGDAPDALLINAIGADRLTAVGNLVDVALACDLPLANSIGIDTTPNRVALPN
jgi:hypothetical protein